MNTTFQLDSGPVSARLYEAATADADRPVLVLAHGAGAPQSHPFMVAMARAIADQGIDVWTFNFPYMDAGRRLPDRLPVLTGCFAAVTAHVATACEGRRVSIGGKSLGGRVATHVAADAPAGARPAGVVCLGYPLRPPSGATTDRTSHLARLAVPALIVQGTRDPFGGPDAIRDAFAVSAAPVLVVAVQDGGHSFEVRRKTGLSPAAVQAQVAAAIAGWLQSPPAHRGR